ncbi:MAG: hypothetical protein GX326_07700 [Clostridiaceae bacterium]|nr:hypothetical protein [Clostridiaceae bacterium]
MDKIKEIVAVILSEAEDEAKKIQANADAEIKTVRLDLEAELAELDQATEQTIIADTESSKQRGQSLLESRLREYDLQQRQAVIEEIINQAVASFKALPFSEKTDIYQNAVEAAGIKAGEIRLNEQDQPCLEPLLEKLGEGFAKGEVANIEGGLLVTHDRIEENLSIDLILRDKRTDLASFIAKLLF